MITPESWPADPRECHDLLNRLNQQVEDLHAALDQAAKLHDQTVQEHRKRRDFQVSARGQGRREMPA